MKRTLLLILCALTMGAAAYGQQRVEVRGNVVNAVTKEPVAGVLVTLRGSGQSETTDASGEFSFLSVPVGEDVIALSSSEIIAREFMIKTEPNAITTLRDIAVVVMQVQDSPSGAGIIESAALDDDASGGAGSQEVSSMVILSNDVYLNKVGFALSPFRFKVRGYDNNYEEKYINGVPFNDQLRGQFSYSSIGALNNVTRNGDVNTYHNPSVFTFGTIGGSENINMRAGSYARGSQLTLTYTNRNYYARGMFTYSTGLNDRGFAFTASVGGRYSDEGNVSGTFYRNLAYMFGIEKQWADGKHSIAVTTFGSPVQRGQQSASFQEAYDLTGDNQYNPNWGWQNGKKRNSRMVTAFDPTLIVSHTWKISDRATLNTGIGAHYSRYGSTALNWYSMADVRPDYYRNMPSYYLYLLDENPDQYDQIMANYNEMKYRWENKYPDVTQVNWYSLYEANKYANENGESAKVVLEERRSDIAEVSFNSTLNIDLSDRSKLTAGIGVRGSRSMQFKTIDDMLGAAYLEDKDKYAERDLGLNVESVWNDLNKPGRRVYEGDRFGYDFDINIWSANLWVQNQYSTRLVDINYGTKLSYTTFQRDGNMRNGRFPDSSYGKGERHNFYDYGFKVGALVKLSGRHLLQLNANYETKAPQPYNAYTSVRITDNTVDLQSEKILSADLSYIFSLPSFTGRVSYFETHFWDQMERQSYYWDNANTFVNHILTDVDKVHRGVEFGAKYRLDGNWSFDLAGTVSEYYYNSDPMGTISYENNAYEDVSESVFLKNYYVGGAPQIAGVFSVNYFYNYWFFELSVNGAARQYIDLAPMRRVWSNYDPAGENGVNPADPASVEAYQKLIKQERFGSACTFDFSIGKILYLKNRRSMNFNLSFNNILNRRNIKTGGYEQARINLSYPDRFNSKYFYMQGFNCFINASYKF